MRLYFLPKIVSLSAAQSEESSQKYALARRGSYFRRGKWKSSFLEKNGFLLPFGESEREKSIIQRWMWPPRGPVGLAQVQ